MSSLHGAIYRRKLYYLNSINISAKDFGALVDTNSAVCCCLGLTALAVANAGNYFMLTPLSVYFSVVIIIFFILSNTQTHHTKEKKTHEGDVLHKVSFCVLFVLIGYTVVFLGIDT